MTRAKSVHSTPRRTASKIQPQKSIPAAIDPTALPDEYCLSLAGDCLEPMIPDGAAIYLRKSETFGTGDVVCIWFRPEFVPPGENQAWLKSGMAQEDPTEPAAVGERLPYKDHPESDLKAILVVEQSNPPRCYEVRCDRIRAIHKAVGYSDAIAKIGGTVSTADMLPNGKAVRA
jgi:hypothetical protein